MCVSVNTVATGSGPGYRHQHTMMPRRHVCHYPVFRSYCACEPRQCVLTCYASRTRLSCTTGTRSTASEFENQTAALGAGGSANGLAGLVFFFFFAVVDCVTTVRTSNNMIGLVHARRRQRISHEKPPHTRKNHSPTLDAVSLHSSPFIKAAPACVIVSFEQT